jgi:hypothetical protein
MVRTVCASLAYTLIHQHVRALCVAVDAPSPQASARHHALSPPQSGPGTTVPTDVKEIPSGADSARELRIIALGEFI